MLGSILNEARLPKILALAFLAFAMGPTKAEDVQEIGRQLDIQAPGDIYDFEYLPDGGIVVAGDFTVISGIYQPFIAKFNSDGSINRSWRPQLDGPVRGVAVDANSDIYIHGDFSTIDSLPRQKLARILHETGTVDAWGGSEPFITALAVGNDYVYVGRRSSQVLARRSKGASGAIDETWVPALSGSVSQIALTEDSVYVVGALRGSNGFSQSPLQRVDLAGQVDPLWINAISPVFPNRVNDIETIGTSLFVAGSFSTIRGVQQARIAKIGSGGIVDLQWRPSLNGEVTSLSVDRSRNLAFASGHFTQLGTTSVTPNIALSVAGLGNQVPFSPSTQEPLQHIASLSTGLLVAGLFRSIDQVRAISLATVSIDGSGPAALDAVRPGRISAILPTADALYIGGVFHSIDGNDFENAARLIEDRPDQSWRPVVRGEVLAIGVNSSDVFLGGDLSAGSCRNLCKFNKSSASQLNQFAPNPNARVLQISATDNDVVIGGSFSQVAGLLTRLARLDSVTGQPVGNQVTLGGGSINVSNFFESGDFLYVSGAFTSVNGSSRQNIARIVRSSFVLDSWSPQQPVRQNTPISASNLHVYALTSGTGGGLRRFDVSAGAVDLQWLPVVPGLDFFDSLRSTPMTLIQDRLFIANSTTKLTAVSLSSQARSVSAWARFIRSAKPYGSSADFQPAPVNALAGIGGSVVIGGRFQSDRGVNALAVAVASQGNDDFLVASGFEASSPAPLELDAAESILLLPSSGDERAMPLLVNDLPFSSAPAGASIEIQHFDQQRLTASVDNGRLLVRAVAGNWRNSYVVLVLRLNGAIRDSIALPVSRVDVSGGASFVPADLVSSLGDGAVTVSRNAQTESLLPGTIVYSQGTLGFSGTISQRTVGATSITWLLAPVPLTSFITGLEIPTLQTKMVSNGLSGQKAPTCEAQGTMTISTNSNVQRDGPDIFPSFSINADPISVELGIVARAGVLVDLPDLQINGSGTVKCGVSFGLARTTLVNIAGIRLEAGGSVFPGMLATGTFGGSVSQGSVSYDLSAESIMVADLQGIRWKSDPALNVDRYFQPPKSSGFSEFGGFFGPSLETGISFTLSRNGRTVISADALNLGVNYGLFLGIESPLDWRNVDYSGPRWGFRGEAIIEPFSGEIGPPVTELLRQFFPDVPQTLSVELPSVSRELPEVRATPSIEDFSADCSGGCPLETGESIVVRGRLVDYFAQPGPSSTTFVFFDDSGKYVRDVPFPTPGNPFLEQFNPNLAPGQYLVAARRFNHDWLTGVFPYVSPSTSSIRVVGAPLAPTFSYTPSPQSHVTINQLNSLEATFELLVTGTSNSGSIEDRTSRFENCRFSNFSSAPASVQSGPTDWMTVPALGSLQFNFIAPVSPPARASFRVLPRPILGEGAVLHFRAARLTCDEIRGTRNPVPRTWDIRLELDCRTEPAPASCGLG